jgi:hypothetical protein
MPVPADTPRGSLKVYLGYAAGVGKTFQMLADGRAAAQRGVDVVVAYFQPHARPDTIAQVQGLEIVPHHKIEYRDRTFEEMDTEAVLLSNTLKASMIRYGRSQESRCAKRCRTESYGKRRKSWQSMLHPTRY